MKIALVQSPLAWGELQENLQNFDKKMAECEDCDVHFGLYDDKEVGRGGICR